VTLFPVSEVIPSESSIEEVRGNVVEDDAELAHQISGALAGKDWPTWHCRAVRPVLPTLICHNFFDPFLSTPFLGPDFASFLNL